MLERRVGRLTIINVIALGGGSLPSCDGRRLTLPRASCRHREAGWRSGRLCRPCSGVHTLASLSLSRPWHLLWVSRRYRKAGWRGGCLHRPGAGMHTLALLSSSCHGRLDVFVLAWTCCRLAVIVFIVLAWMCCHRHHCHHHRVMVAFAMHASLSLSLSWWWLHH